MILICPKLLSDEPVKQFLTLYGEILETNTSDLKSIYNLLKSNKPKWSILINTFNVYASKKSLPASLALYHQYQIQRIKKTKENVWGFVRCASCPVPRQLLQPTTGYWKVVKNGCGIDFLYEIGFF